MARGSRGSDRRSGPAPRRPLEVDELLEVIDAHEVEYVIIGGFAVAAHGHPRATKDVDICPNPKQANLRRLAAALEELEATPIDLDEFDLQPDYEGLRQGGNWTLMTKHGRVDVMQTFSFEGTDEELGDYTDLAGHAVSRDFYGKPRRFCGYEDLLAMKRAANRDQDRIDVNSLKQARREL
ncbi:MAG TPA: hypothetical protein VG898_11375 [Solirubrobacterales bacterium]|nr:hypothetical protein [Solirubrobacterales bacterium]